MAAASPFLTRWLPELARAAAGGPVADLACGRGRNALAAAAWGLRVVGLDRDASLLRELGHDARRLGLTVSRVRTDLEAAQGIPLAPGACAGILVFRFLFRPLAPALVEALRPGGFLLYETFTTEQPALGWGPRRPAFLLEPGELPGLFPGLAVLESWEGVRAGERPEAVACLAARRP